jgi:hypothetical protein
MSTLIEWAYDLVVYSMYTPSAWAHIWCYIKCWLLLLGPKEILYMEYTLILDGPMAWWYI